MLILEACPYRFSGRLRWLEAMFRERQRLVDLTPFEEPGKFHSPLLQLTRQAKVNTSHIRLVLCATIEK